MFPPLPSSASRCLSRFRASSPQPVVFVAFPRVLSSFSRCLFPHFLSAAFPSPPPNFLKERVTLTISMSSCAKSLSQSASLRPHGLQPTRPLCPGILQGRTREWLRVLLQGVFPAPARTCVSRLLRRRRLCTASSTAPSPRQCGGASALPLRTKLGRGARGLWGLSRAVCCLQPSPGLVCVIVSGWSSSL